MLPMALFGILGYVEPVLIVAVAVLLLGESLSAQQLGTYGPIWVAVALSGLAQLPGDAVACGPTDAVPSVAIRVAISVRARVD